jgi:hypothetical protein
MLRNGANVHVLPWVTYAVCVLSLRSIPNVIGSERTIGDRRPPSVILETMLPVSIR